MHNDTVRGSAKLQEAWKLRDAEITDAVVEEISALLDKSPAEVGDVQVHGGSRATGLGFSLSYYGDDVPFCGNDLQWLIDFLRKHPIPSEGPIVIINGKPRVDRIHVLASLGVLPDSAWDVVVDKFGGPRNVAFGH
jgi:hypothetical protein